MNKQFLLLGELRFPLRFSSHKCGYKYVLCNEKDKPRYEEIVEYQSQFRGPVNRCLDIERKHISKNSKY